MLSVFNFCIIYLGPTSGKRFYSSTRKFLYFPQYRPDGKELLECHKEPDVFVITRMPCVNSVFTTVTLERLA
jgi:hypothetical protein